MTKAAYLEASYENVAAECPSCGVRNVYNRATDIGHFDAIANHRVVCFNDACQVSFDICGDLINPAHEALVLDSREFLKEKRYMQAVLSAATAYESLFSHFLRVELVYRPSRRDATSQRDEIDWLNAAARALQDKTAGHSFEAMRRIFLRLAIDNVQPSTLAQADEYIGGIPNRPPKVPRSDIEAIADEPRRETLLQIYDSCLAKLRNDIVHKKAYRPHLAETTAAVEDTLQIIFRFGQLYNLANDNYHLNETVDDP